MVPKNNLSAPHEVASEALNFLISFLKIRIPKRKKESWFTSYHSDRSSREVKSIPLRDTFYFTVTLDGGILFYHKNWPKLAPVTSGGKLLTLQ